MKKRLTFKQLLFEQQILGILLFTILVVFLWVVSSIYFSYAQTTLTTEDTTTVIPLTPEINEKPLLELANRKWWTPEELTQIASGGATQSR
jgi:sensor histidine kinase regulating citrate/malate metabolism